MPKVREKYLPVVLFFMSYELISFTFSVKGGMKS